MVLSLKQYTDFDRIIVNYLEYLWKEFYPRKWISKFLFREKYCFFLNFCWIWWVNVWLQLSKLLKSLKKFNFFFEGKFKTEINELLG